MSSYEISKVAGVAAAAQALAKDGTVIVAIGGHPVTIRFQADSLPSEEAANNIMVTIKNLNNTQDFDLILGNSEAKSYIVNLTTSPLGLPSSGITMFGVGIINININEVNREYMTPEGVYEKFTLQHIVNHEIMHTITGLPDGPEFNRIVNEINSQTQAGPPRYDYDSVRCFLADTSIALPNGSTKMISEIRLNDLVMAFNNCNKDNYNDLTCRRVTRIFRNISRNIIDLRGLRCTPGHVFLSRVPNIQSKNVFRTIAAILHDDGTIVDHLGQALRARTGAFVDSVNDISLRVSYYNPINGEECCAVVRAGIPVVTSNDLKSAENAEKRTISLADWVYMHGLAILIDGTIRSSENKIFDIIDWPEGSTPFDTIEMQNWVVTGPDGQPYTPPWIVDLGEEDEHASLRVVGEMPSASVSGFHPSIRTS